MGRALIVCVLVLILASSPVYAAESLTTDVFGDWTLADTLPGVWAYANQTINTLGPMAWLVGGILVGSLAISTIIDIVRAAVSRADE